MKTSMWSSYFIDLSPEEMVTAFSGKGWFYSELSDEHAAALLERGNPENIGEKFRIFAEEHGVHFLQGHLWLRVDIAAINQRVVLDQLKSWLDLFHAIGIRNAVLHPGGAEMRMEGREPDKIMEAQVGGLRELAEHIKGTEMTLCLENLIKSASECEDLLRLIEAAACSNIGICLDTGHLNLCSGDQSGFIRKAGSYLKALHIADNEGKTDQHLMPFGRGTVQWKEVMSALKEINYSQLFNFEIPGESRCPLEVRLAKLDYIRYMASFLLENA